MDKITKCFIIFMIIGIINLGIGFGLYLYFKNSFANLFLTIGISTLISSCMSYIAINRNLKKYSNKEIKIIKLNKN